MRGLHFDEHHPSHSAVFRCTQQLMWLRQYGTGSSMFLLKAYIRIYSTAGVNVSVCMAPPAVAFVHLSLIPWTCNPSRAELCPGVLLNASCTSRTQLLTSASTRPTLADVAQGPSSSRNGDGGAQYRLNSASIKDVRRCNTRNPPGGKEHNDHCNGTFSDGSCRAASFLW